MKTVISVLLWFFLLLTPALSCTNTLITIGSLDSPENRVLAEMVSVLIYERTGIKVGRNFYPDAAAVYAAVELQEIDIVIENSPAALALMPTGSEASPEADYERVKSYFQKNKGLIWMEPFGFGNQHDPPLHTSPLIRSDTLNSYPGLPRVVSRLAGVVDDETLASLLARVHEVIDDRKQIRQVARQFLLDRKLI